MAVSAVSANSLATALQAFRPDVGAKFGGSPEKAKGSEGDAGTMPSKPTVNSSGQTIGTTFSTAA